MQSPPLNLIVAPAERPRPTPSGPPVQESLLPQISLSFLEALSLQAKSLPGGGANRESVALVATDDVVQIEAPQAEEGGETTFQGTDLGLVVSLPSPRGPDNECGTISPGDMEPESLKFVQYQNGRPEPSWQGDVRSATLERAASADSRVLPDDQHVSWVLPIQSTSQEGVAASQSLVSVGSGAAGAIGAVAQAARGSGPIPPPAIPVADAQPGSMIFTVMTADVGLPPIPTAAGKMTQQDIRLESSPPIADFEKGSSALQIPVAAPKLAVRRDVGALEPAPMDQDTSSTLRLTHLMTDWPGTTVRKSNVLPETSIGAPVNNTDTEHTRSAVPVEQAWPDRAISDLTLPTGVDLDMRRLHDIQRDAVRPQTPLLARHVAHQLSIAVTPITDGVTELSLDPVELGRVRMSVVAHDQTATLMIAADRPETIDLMRRHVDVLQQEFRAQGYTSVTFGFAEGQGQSGAKLPSGSPPQIRGEDDIEESPPLTRSQRGRGPTGSLDISL